MKLTVKEAEIMTVLWNSESPLTTTEIIETSPNRTWQDRSIFVIMRSLLKKGAVVLDRYKPTAGKHARSYKPLITTEDYVLEVIQDMNESGMKIDVNALANRLKKAKEE
ncbi:MAG: BlaI/MecI/CopY family transcriptional regulator [Defluviitaleaceae bacterium]|nr:BlaI/MecI/CopY family transcriptional regulator [Defluviitaleaceae bacterium]